MKMIFKIIFAGVATGGLLLAAPRANAARGQLYDRPSILHEFFPEADRVDTEMVEITPELAQELQTELGYLPVRDDLHALDARRREARGRDRDRGHPRATGSARPAPRIRHLTVKDFGRSPGRLGGLEPAAKGVYTLWMSFALVHFASSFAMYWER